MNPRRRTTPDRSPARTLPWAPWLGAAVLWTVLLAVFGATDLRRTEHEIVTLAATEADASFNKDLVYRRWAASHGGVYVPPTERTPPNPYLAHLPHRDVVTTDGMRLTLVNPAYMTRQVHELGKEQYGVRGHITSLKPLRPENAPDPWETRALESFEHGAKQASAIVEADGEPELRRMYALYVERPCLTCHGVQGYEVGQVRGGISVSVPLKPFQAAATSVNRRTALQLALVWAAGLLGLGFMWRLVRRQYRILQGAQAATAATEERLARTFRSAPLMMTLSVLDDGTCLDVNDRFLETSGFAREEVLGRTVVDLGWIAGEERERLHARLLAEGRVSNVDVRARAKDGRTVLCAYSAEILEIEGRRCLVSIALDVTERRRLEWELRENEQLLRQSQRMAAVGHYVYDVAADRWRSSEMLDEIFGIGPEYRRDLQGWLGLLHDGDRGRMHAHFQGHVLADGGTFDAEYRIVRAEDGAERWVHGLGELRRDPQGQSLQLFGTIQDITDRRRAEQALRESEERYRGLFETSLDGISILDLEGRYVDCNPAFARLLGYDAADALRGVTSREVTPTEFHETERRIHEEQTLGRGYCAPYVKEFLTRSGERVPVRVQEWLSRNAEGAPEGVWAIVHDRTSEVQAEAEKAELERRLLQAQKMEAIGTLAGGIAHDFNNILTPIMAHADFALMRLPEESPAREDLTQLLAAAERATDLVRQILAISRKEDAEAWIPVNLGALVKESLKLLRASLPATLDIRVDVDPDCPPVLGSPSQFHQLILNLCTNARDAMEDGPGVLTMTVARADEGPRDRVRLAVRDTGRGIPRDFRHRIFEPYFTTKPRGKGTGLGLTVVHAIVTNLGGEVRVRSEAGEGTVFELLLPATERPEPPPARPLQPALRGRGERVLVVEDEEAVRAVVDQTLTTLGYRVTCHANAAAALAAFRSDPEAFDGVLTDYTMPGRTGLDLAGELLRLRPGLPVLLSTGFAEAVTEDAVVARGLSGVVMKPFTVRKLGEALRRALEKASAAGAGLAN